MAKGMQNKSEDFAEGKTKSRNIAVMLYPDNRYHMEYLDYLKEYGRGFYIKHKAEADEKKDHIHLVHIFSNARTVKGYLKSLPTVDYVKDDDGKLTSNFEKEDKKKIITKPLLDHAEIISCMNSYCVYLMHEDYKSVKAGKTRYHDSDVVSFGSSDNLFESFYRQDKLTDMEIIKLLLSFNAATKKRLLEKVVEYGNHQVFAYVQSHGYFINEFLMKP